MARSVIMPDSGSITLPADTGVVRESYDMERKHSIEKRASCVRIGVRLGVGIDIDIKKPACKPVLLFCPAPIPNRVRQEIIQHLLGDSVFCV